ncbi:3'-5' exonuclease [Arthrobacter sp. HMSC08H08]|uniref:3'-5' exonuclease n=1 Tax=Arthrobacter sp. HMSC08H08 TaxID=1581143 RepID=UPI0008A5139F|nr:3'-5' exonuclease [Arthrobacter sp. HMSC08H08]OFT22906.1 DNA polymerase III subunit epsilon [Arthrobacter sp. HMSC08H08]
MTSSSAHSAPHPWHELPRAAFDLETTSPNPHEARIVSANISIINGKAELMQSHNWLVNPGVPIPPETTKIHGISDADVQADGRDPVEAVREMSELLSQLFQTMPVIAFNAPYDFTVLRSEAQRHGVETIDASPVIDPLVLDRKLDRFRRGKRTLSVMSEFYNVPLNKAHTADADALAAVGVADEIARRYPAEVQIVPLLLHSQQVQWHQEWAANFQDFLRRKNPSARVDGSWPLTYGGAASAPASRSA